MPIYANKSKDDNKLLTLVRAANKTAALRHVAETSFNSNKATQEDLLTSLQTGVQVQDAPEPTRRSKAEAAE